MSKPPIIYRVLCEDRKTLSQVLIKRATLPEKDRIAAFPVVGLKLASMISEHASQLGLITEDVTAAAFLSRFSGAKAIPIRRSKERAFVVALGRRGLPSAAYWSSMRGEPLIVSDSPESAARSLKKAGVSVATVVISEEFSRIPNLIALNRALGRFQIPFGVVFNIEPDVVCFQAVKNILHRLAGWNPAGQFHYAPVDPFPFPQPGDGQVFLGPRHDSPSISAKLQSELSLLTILTHSNGFNGFLGKDFVFCSNEEYPSKQIAGDGLLPCFHGAKCNRGTDNHFLARDLRARVFALFSCGGIVPDDGHFAARHSFGHQISGNGFVEAFFSSFWVYEASGDRFLDPAFDFLGARTAGEAALNLCRSLGASQPDIAETCFLVGDPLAPLPLMFRSQRTPLRREKGRSMVLPLSLQGERLKSIITTLPNPKSQRSGSRFLVSYDAGGEIPVGSLRGATRKSGRDLKILLYPIQRGKVSARLNIRPHFDFANTLSNLASCVYGHVQFTRHYLDWADNSLSEADVNTPLIILKRLENQSLRLTSWIKGISSGSLVDERLVISHENSLKAELGDFHRFFLKWHRLHVSKSGSRIQKTWSRFLRETKRTGGTSCRYCGYKSELLEYDGSPDGFIRRFILCCRRCWFVADVACPDYPLGFTAPDEAIPAKTLVAELFVRNPHQCIIKGDAVFVLEDFQPGGPLTTFSEAAAFEIPPSQETLIRVHLPVHPQLPPGQYILSCSYCLNGSLNVLRKHIECRTTSEIKHATTAN